MYMIQPELLDFIQKQLAKNTDRATITSKLINNGWPLDIVNAAFIEMTINGSLPAVEQNIPVPTASQQVYTSQQLNPNAYTTSSFSDMQQNAINLQSVKTTETDVAIPTTNPIMQSGLTQQMQSMPIAMPLSPMAKTAISGPAMFPHTSNTANLPNSNTNMTSFTPTDSSHQMKVMSLVVGGILLLAAIAYSLYVFVYLPQSMVQKKNEISEIENQMIQEKKQ